MERKSINYCLYVLPLFYTYSFINTFISRINNVPSILNNILIILRIGMYIYILFTFLRSIKKLDFKIIFFIFVLAIPLIISVIVFLHNGTPERFKEYLYTIVFSVIPLSIAIHFTDYNSLIRKLSKLGIIFGYIYAIIGGLALKGSIILPNYDMSLGYCAIIPMACLLYQLFWGEEKRKIIGFFSISFYIAFTVVFASRGPLVNLLILFVYLEFFSKKSTSKMSKVFTVLILLMVLLLYRPMLDFSVTALNKVGLRSRTLELITNNDIYHSSGREQLYSVIIEKIRENPFAIRGISSETRITYKNQYAHNMYLELLYQFGIFPGLVFLIIVTFMCIKDLRPSVLSSAPLISIFLIISFVTLQFSSSIWLNYNFWIWLSMHLKHNKFKEIEE